MNSKHSTNYGFYDTVTPIKLTETGRLKIHTKGWGILADYYIESVKINNRKDGISSVATLRMGDVSGQCTCVIKGSSVSLLFGLSFEEWKDVENMCPMGQQLFYRYFKNGLTQSFSYEQKLFYNMCASNKNEEVFVAKFVKCYNTRKTFQDEPLLDILELRKCDMHLMDLYTSHLQEVNNLLSSNHIMVTQCRKCIYNKDPKEI